VKIHKNIRKHHHFLTKIRKYILNCIKSWKTYHNLDKIVINSIIIIVRPIKIIICIMYIYYIYLTYIERLLGLTEKNSCGGQIRQIYVKNVCKIVQ